jgi:uroporphyrinogen-III synthase
VRLLITRPAAAARALARELEASGHETLIEPLLSIQPIEGVTPDLEGVQAIVLTSANAVPALDRPAKALPVFTVGDATAAAARAAGCARVMAAAGDATSLAGLIAAQLRPGDGALLHLAGTEVRPGLDRLLGAAGFRVRRQEVYRACPATHLSAATLASLRDRALDAVLLFSPRTAATFVRLIQDHQLQASLEKTEAICLSAAVAKACSDLPWTAVRIAARSAEDAMVQLLDARP